MTSILAVDVGGSSVKLGRWHSGKLTPLGKQPTPRNLIGYYHLLKESRERLQRVDDVQGIAISLCGLVDREEGIVNGNGGIPYIQNSLIHHELSKRLNVDVSIENDANCAGLAESRLGAGRNDDTVVMLVLGSGVGGALMNRGNVHHGRHLFGGEFGHMIMDQNEYRTLSDSISPVRVAKRFSEQYGHQVSGEKLFQMALNHHRAAQMAVDEMMHSLAHATYNIQNTLDPDRIIIGGAISANRQLLPLLNHHLDRFIEHIRFAGVRPKISMAKFDNGANQLGAVINFCETYQLKMANV